MDPFEPRPPRPYPAPAVVPPARSRDRASARVADFATRQAFPPLSIVTPAALHDFEMAAATANPLGMPLSARIPALAMASDGPPTPASFASGSAPSTTIPTALHPRATMADVLSTIGTTPSTVAALDKTAAALVAAASLHASATSAAGAVRSDAATLTFTAQPTTSNRYPPHDVPMAMPLLMPASGAPTVDVDPILLHATVTAVIVAAAALNGGASTLSSPAITGLLNASPDTSSMYDASRYSSAGFRSAAAVASPFPHATLGPANVDVATVATTAAAMLSASGVFPSESTVDTEPGLLDLQLPPAPLSMRTPSTLWPSSAATETVPLTSSTCSTPTCSNGFRDAGFIPLLWPVSGSDAMVAPAPTPAFATFTPPDTPLVLGLHHGTTASGCSGAPARSGLGSTRYGTASNSMRRAAALGSGSAFSAAAAASQPTTSLFPSMTAAAALPSAWAPRTDPGPATAQFGPSAAAFSTATSAVTIHPATAMDVLSCAPVPPPVSTVMPRAFAAAPAAFRVPDQAASIFMPPPPQQPPVMAAGPGSRESSVPMGSGSADARVSPPVPLSFPHPSNMHTGTAPPSPPSPAAAGSRDKGRARVRGRGGVRSTPATRRKTQKDVSSSTADAAGVTSPATTAADDRPKVFQCPVCEKTFTRAFNLKSHVMTHSNSRPYVCRYCDRTFARKHDCERHQRLHTGDRPYRCGACGVGFPRHDALARHLRSDLKCAQEFQMTPRRPSASTVAVAVPPAVSGVEKDEEEDLGDELSQAAVRERGGERCGGRGRGGRRG